MTDICARIAAVLLVDPAGRLLLQLRDGNTRIDPHRWCVPGGELDPGEEPLLGALRELAEETGLEPDTDPELFWHGPAPSARYPGAVAEFFVYCAATTAADHDVQCNEGAAMRFIDREDVAGLQFGAAYAVIVSQFLSSEQYRRSQASAGDTARHRPSAVS